jgi:hypothetical protein
VTAQRKPFFLLTQATILFSFWMPAAGVKQANFGHEFRDRATETLADYGFSESEIGVILQDGPDVFAISCPPREHGDFRPSKSDRQL